MTVEAIREFLYDYGIGRDGIGSMHVDVTREGSETDRTICLLDESIYDALIREGFGRTPQSADKRRRDDFTISLYHFKPESSTPAPGHTYNFFIQLPKLEGREPDRADPRSGTAIQRVSMKANTLQKQLGDAVEELIKFGLIPGESVELKVPFTSRTTGDSKGVAYVTFANNVPRENIAAARVILDKSIVWGSGNVPYRIKCVYAREMKPAQDKVKKAFVPATVTRSPTVGPAPLGNASAFPLPGPFASGSPDSNPPAWRRHVNSQEAKEEHQTQ